jgi:hypothetical protein
MEMRFALLTVNDYAKIISNEFTIQREGERIYLAGIGLKDSSIRYLMYFSRVVLDFAVIKCRLIFHDDFLDEGVKARQLSNAIGLFDD